MLLLHCNTVLSYFFFRQAVIYPSAIPQVSHNILKRFLWVLLFPPATVPYICCCDLLLSNIKVDGRNPVKESAHAWGKARKESERFQHTLYHVCQMSYLISFGSILLHWHHRYQACCLRLTLQWDLLLDC